MYIYSLCSVLIVSLISFVGAFSLATREKTLRKYIVFFVSLAVGALLGDAFIHLIPEAFENTSSPTMVSLLILVGIFIFFMFEKILHWHHHPECSDTHIHPVGKMVLFSDGLHNMIDGVIIGISYLISMEVGIATTIAVILHEIPQEIGDFSILIHAGYSKVRALWLNFISALFAVVGLFLVFIVGEATEHLITFIIPLAAGGFIYIAMSDLIPELHTFKKKKNTITQICAIALGILLMIGLLYLE